MAISPVEVFCRAVWRREYAAIAALASKVDPNAKDKWGNTPLLAAAQYGDLALVKLLVLRGGELNQGKHGADPNARDKRGVPVHASAKAPDVRAILEKYLGAKAKPARSKPARTKSKVSKRRAS